jgi:hypothetical protein
MLVFSDRRVADGHDPRADPGLSLGDRHSAIPFLKEAFQNATADIPVVR